MKTINNNAIVMALTLVLLAGSALATELKVPQLAPKRIPVVVAPLPALPETMEQCQARIATYCGGTHRTRLFTKACVFRNRYQCRGKG
jgi:hypothetical protein